MEAEKNHLLDKDVQESVVQRILDVFTELVGFEKSMVRDRGNLDSIGFQLAKEFKDRGEVYVYEFAASVLYRIATEHPFVDANKRTAFLTAISIISDNYEIEKEKMIEFYENIYFKRRGNKDDEIVKFMLETAKGNKNKDEVIKFLEELGSEIKKL